MFESKSIGLLIVGLVIGAGIGYLLPSNLGSDTSYDLEDYTLEMGMTENIKDYLRQVEGYYQDIEEIDDEEEQGA